MSSTTRQPVGCFPLIRVDLYPPPTNDGSMTPACFRAHSSREMDVSITQYPSTDHLLVSGTMSGKALFHSGWYSIIAAIDLVIFSALSSLAEIVTFVLCGSIPIRQHWNVTDRVTDFHEPRKPFSVNPFPSSCALKILATHLFPVLTGRRKPYSSS